MEFAHGRYHEKIEGAWLRLARPYRKCKPETPAKDYVVPVWAVVEFLFGDVEVLIDCASFLD
jgi:hypothetical protein